MPNPLPYLPLWVNDWSNSLRVKNLNLNERGLYIEVLMIQWRMGHIPDDPGMVAMAAGISAKQVRWAWPAVRVLLESDDDGNLFSPRLREEQNKAAARSAKASKAAQMGCVKRDTTGRQPEDNRKTTGRQPEDTKPQVPQNQQNGSANAQHSDTYTEAYTYSTVSPLHSGIASAVQKHTHVGFRARAIGGNGNGNGKPGPSVDVERFAEQLYAAHPKKKNRVLAEQQIVDLCLHGGVDLDDVLFTHALWCRSENWKKENGRFCPPLDQWISDHGYDAYPDEFENEYLTYARNRKANLNGKQILT